MLSFKEFVLQEALKIATKSSPEFRFFRDQYKNWNKENYLELFKLISSKLSVDHDRKYYRLYIPFTQTAAEPSNSVVEFIESKGFKIIDYNQGIIQKEDSKGKLVTNSIQSVLSKFKQPELEKEYIRSRTLDKGSEYWIVISRHAYDLLGMSTDRDWSSCMKIGGHRNYCEYLPMDIIQGSLIAYLIKAEDKNINSPIGRLTIRPYINDTGDVAFGQSNEVYHSGLTNSISSEFKLKLGQFLTKINRLQNLEGVFNIKPDLYPESDETKIIFKDEEDQKIYDLVMDDPKELINYPNISEKLLLTIVNQNSKTLKYIKDPTEKVQLIAINQDGNNIKHIKDPSEKVQLTAVKEDGLSIRYIKKPTEEVKLDAVKRNGSAIYFIKNPSEEVQLAAVNQNGLSIENIDNPSEKVQLVAVKQNGYAIQYIKNPSDEMKLIAVSKHGSAIEYIDNPSEEMQLAAVNQDWFAISYIKNPSEEVQLAAVNKRPDSIRFIKNPTEKVKQLSAKGR